MTTEVLRSALESFAFDPGYEDRLDELGDAIRDSPEAAALVPDVLRLFERFPNEDFGSPGPLAHAIERLYGRGYEQHLLDSLARRPTSLTLWLANRIANARDHNHAAFVASLDQVAVRTDLDESTRGQAAHFAQLHVPNRE